MWLLVVIGIAAGLLLAREWAARSQRPNVIGSVRPNGDCNLEVVGESHYQPALRAAAGKGEVRHHCRATLVLEASNRYDNKAVRVDVNGRTVGYLSHDEARSYRRAIKNCGDLECDAVIVGGGKGRSLGIWLDVGENDEVD